MLSNQEQKSITSWLILLMLINKNCRGINKICNQTEIQRQEIRRILNKMPSVSPAVIVNHQHTHTHTHTHTKVNFLKSYFNNSTTQLVLWSLIGILEIHTMTATPVRKNCVSFIYWKLFSKHKNPSALKSYRMFL